MGSWKSIHVIVVPMFTELDCSSRVLADPPLVEYSAAMAFPDDAPSMYAIMSVTDPDVVEVKYETDWALASFWSVYVPIMEFPKIYDAGGAVAARTATEEKTESMPMRKSAVMHRAASLVSFLSRMA